MNKRRSKQIRRPATELYPSSPRWAARWMRRHRSFDGAGLPKRATVTRFASWLRMVWPKPTREDKRTGSFKGMA